MKVALLYNQKPDIQSGTDKYASDEYAEWDNPETIDAVAAALSETHHVIKIDCHPNRLREIIETLEREKPDICFNIAEGAGAVSREAQVPALLEMLGLKYTASDPMTLCITLDKARTKEILAYHNIPTPAFHLVSSLRDIEPVLAVEKKFPLIVKPLHEGSSKGIFERSVVSTNDDLKAQLMEVLTQYRQPALIEEFLSGREFTVALLGNGESVEVLPIVELTFDHLPHGSKRIYSYEAKWLWDNPQNPVEVFHCPAPLTPPLEKSIAKICQRAFAALRCRDWARIDVRLDEYDNPYIIEVNPLPGILPNPDEHSCFPMAARQAGLSYNQLINRVLNEALQRYNASPMAGNVLVRT